MKLIKNVNFVRFSVKRDHHGMSEKQMCDEGEAFCWMACRPYPNHNNTCSVGNEMVCFSSTSNITCGTDPEYPEPMDQDCKWQCMPEPDPEYRYSLRNLVMLIYFE